MRLMGPLRVLNGPHTALKSINVFQSPSKSVLKAFERPFERLLKPFHRPGLSKLFIRSIWPYKALESLIRP